MAENATIIVVGAGIAGLRCAQLLREQLPASTQVVVLEAAPRVGGRVVQDTTFMPGMTLEVGAEFLHGSDTSMNRLAHQLGLPAQELFTWAQGDGGPLPPSDPSAPAHALYYLGAERRMLNWDSVDADFRALNAAILSLADTDAQETDGDARSVAQWLRDAGALPQRMQGLAASGFANTAGAPLAALPLCGTAHLAREWEADGEGDFRLQQGLASVIAHLVAAAGGDVRCGWPVARVEWGGEGGGVVVTARDGREVRGSHVVVAVPLPVMQDGDIEFAPPLPREKREALGGFGMCRAIKVLLRFSEVWFDPHLHGMICADCFIPEFWFRHAADGGGAIVVGFASGEFADAVMDRHPRDRIVAQALEQLDMMFGPHLGAPTPASRCFLDAKIVDWKTEFPFVRGGYSYPKFGYKSHMGAVIAAPLGGRLFFAGEHTAATAGMTLHAAYDTGTRAAAEVMQAMSGQQARACSGTECESCPSKL